ncbi:MAG: NAD-dependent epimerase/dehydratase family protein [Candidatus Njordarchaeia archaeon]
MVTVFVTGSTGFIGGFLIDSLLEKGFDVVAFARSPEKGKVLEEKGVEVVYGDITNPESIRIPESVDKVIHLAAILKFHGISWQDYYKVNVLGTENVVKAALNSNVDHIIVTSSTEAIGPVNKIPGDENTPPNPAYDYGKSKLLMEQLVKKYIEEKNAPITIIRPTGVFGPKDMYITYSILKAVKGGTLKRLPGGGEHYIQFSYVKNVVEGYIAVLEKRDKAIGEIFIITNEDYYTYREAFTIIAEILGVEPPSGSIPFWLAKMAVWFMETWDRIRSRDDFVRHVSVLRDMMTDRVYSIEKAKKILGYKPKYDFREGMKETITWFQQKGYI